MPPATMTRPRRMREHPRGMAKPSERFDMPESTCSIEGCERPAKCRNWCQQHYMRWYRTGDPENGVRFNQKPPVDGMCTIDDCRETAKARGWCDTHYMRWRKHGSPNVVKTPVGERHYKWTGDEASYDAVHQRLKKHRGKADAHDCICGRRAYQWAYDHGDVDERRGLSGGHEFIYSLKLEHYVPLCASCHKLLDSARARQIAG